MSVSETFAPATIRGVAARAGCSVATVSRVINRSGPASAAVRARVEAAIAELGFRPNALGQNLRAQRAKAVGAVVPSFDNPVFAGSLGGLEEAARAAGRTMLLSSTGYDPGREREVVEGLLAQRVQGLVLTVADADRSPALDRLDRAGVPYVLVYNQPTRSRRHAVTVDNGAASRAVTARLVALGHRRVAFLAGRFRTSDRARTRFEGCAAALAEAGLPPPMLVELDYLASAEEHCRDLARSIRGPGRPTALVCSNDLLALSAMAALRGLGLRVPDDVSVVGFDGIAIGRMVDPSLATIDTPTRAMGLAAMRRLMALIDGESPSPAVELLPFEFRPGGSLAAGPEGPAGGAVSRRRSVAARPTTPRPT